jgi:HAD superfamily hydrolase (TIGR01509 family)
MPALIFDCDGVLADTERYGHLPAFNQMFEEFGLPVHWTEADYAVKVLIGGGKERLASLLTPEFVAAAHLPASRDEQVALVAQWHKRKTEIYTALVASGAMPARPGIHRLVVEAAAQGYTLAVASTSAEPSVRAVLEHAVGPERASTFHVFAGDLVSAKKPAPDIYLAALDALDMRSDEAVVVEDSNNGLRAALAAGLNTIVTVSSFTANEDFTGAALVVSSLGDPDGTDFAGTDPDGTAPDGTDFAVLADAGSIHPHRFVTIADVDAVLALPQPTQETPS